LRAVANNQRLETLFLHRQRLADETTGGQVVVHRHLPERPASAGEGLLWSLTMYNPTHFFAPNPLNRAYGPDQPILDGTWKSPIIELVK
ncbi:MAG TPA: hypothetical protein VIT91_10365, partial [Chthoniobacterales bacterium]